MATQSTHFENFREFYHTDIGKKYCKTAYALFVSILFCCITSCFTKNAYILVSSLTIILLVTGIIELILFLYYSLQLQHERNTKMLFVLHIISAIIFIPVYYSLVYSNYYRTIPASFSTTLSQKLGHFDFFYMSLLTFTSGGCGEIAPNTTVIRIIATTEIFAGIAVFVFIISNADQIIKHVKKNRLRISNR